MKFLIACTLLFAAAPAFAKPAQVLLLRHGEKQELGNLLTAKGWSRAQALPKLFDRPEFHFKGDPVALYAMKPNSDDPSLRPQETLKYVAEKFKLTIDTEFNIDDYKHLVKEVMKDTRNDGKLVVICWEHKVLEDIAVEFGVDPKPKYHKDDFDRAWLLTFEGGDVKFEDYAQKLLPGDSKD